MAAMNSEQLLQAALDLSGMEATADDRVHHPGTRINHVLLGIDIGVGDLFMARQLGYHAVIGYALDMASDDWQVAAQRQRSSLIAIGITEDQADRAIAIHAQRLQARTLSGNADRVPSVARLLDLPFIQIHLPFETIAQTTIQTAIENLAIDEQTTAIAVCAALRSVPHLAHEGAIVPLSDASRAINRLTIVPGVDSSPDRAIMEAYLAQGIDTLLAVAPFAETPELMQIVGIDRAAFLSMGMMPYVAQLRAQGIEVTTYAGVREA